MTLDQVRYAVALAKHQNFSKAAQALYITQPALSRQIANLERELDTPLFYRTAQGVFPTPTGQLFCQEMSAVLTHWSEGLERVSTAIRGAQRQLRIGIGCRAISAGYFDQVVDFFGQFPQVEVTFITDMQTDFQQEIALHRMDFALDRIQPQEYLSQFAIYELIQERQCILMSLDDPRSSLPEISIQELGEDIFISSPQDSRYDKLSQQSSRRYQLSPEKNYRADNVETIMRLIRQGKGLAFGPRSFANCYGVATVPMVPENFVSLNLFTLETQREDWYFTHLHRYLTHHLSP